ncbi:MAG TPA: rod shape-determining protein MreC [Parasegetibacter sp.]|jgi:rod shape-determining protein MreC
MRNIFLFIRRYANFFFFLVLQIVALWLLFSYNKFHQAAFMGVANDITGKLNEEYNSIEVYFKLKKKNQELLEENNRLRNMLQENFGVRDTTLFSIKDTLTINDSSRIFRRYYSMPAQVVDNSTSRQNNYLMINRGYNQGVRKDMGVVSPAGVVGSVLDVSDNYAVVLSMLHRVSRISASVKKTGETGTVEWDGTNPLFVTLKDIPKSVQLNQGDSIVTSRYSDKFPPGILIGTVESVATDPSSNFYRVKVRTATNFFNVQYVYVIENLEKEEQLQLKSGIKINE